MSAQQEELLSAIDQILRGNTDQIEPSTLITAVENSLFGLVQMLVKNGIDLNEQSTDDESTALVTACTSDQQEVANFLIGQPGTDINLVDCDGASALMMAAFHRPLSPIIEKLFSRNDLKLAVMDKKGNMASDTTRYSASFEIAEFIMQNERDKIFLSIDVVVNANGCTFEKAMIKIIAMFAAGGEAKISEHVLSASSSKTCLTEYLKKTPPESTLSEDVNQPPQLNMYSAMVGRGSKRKSASEESCTAWKRAKFGP